MRAAGLLLLLLLGVRSQDDADSADQGKTATTATTGPTRMTITAGTTERPTTSAPAPAPTLTTATTTMTENQTPQHPVEASTAQTTIPTNHPAPSSSPMAKSPTTVTGNTPTTLGSASTTTAVPSHVSRQDSSTQSITTPAASFTTSQQSSIAIATSGSSRTTTAGKLIITQATSPPGATGVAGTSSPTTQPQGNQPSGHLPKTTVSTTVARTDPPESSKECVVSSSPRATKQPPSSSSSAQAPTPSASSGSTGTAATTLIGSPSLATTPMSQPGSKDTVPKEATTTAAGEDQRTHDIGSASGKPTSASQSPDSAQPPDQTESCGSGHQQPNISYPNKLICEDQMQHTRPTIRLKEPRTCDEWRTASNNNSFFESFCSTAQHVFNASRDRCTVTVMACQPHSQDWAVWVVLHHPLDSEEVLKELQEKNDKLEELGIVNITSGKMVEDMTINDEFSMPLIITIITLAGSLLLIAAIYGCHQRFSQKKDQQRLTEEMQTMENGYHDNPTLEVMETSSEMQEKKVNLNGELGDSWIVPLDTLMKEDLEEEEDTHL
ncbi:podocalyxin isoform X2 [Chamaea fasciata]|uniref:podocalyxin isoform X2 n=1 Tax=Chamaea fasciata TaxID=190680 RepID=UPI003369EE95